MTIRTIHELRQQMAAHGIHGTDEELVRRYAADMGQDPVRVAALIGVALASPPPSPLVTRPPQSSVDRVSEKAVGGAVLGASVTLAIALGALAFRFMRRGALAAKAAARSAAAPASVKATASALQSVHPDERGLDEAYAAALEEIAAARQEPAIWARALAASDGVQDRAVALYIRLRVSQHKPSEDQ